MAQGLTCWSVGHARRRKLHDAVQGVICCVGQKRGRRLANSSFALGRTLETGISPINDPFERHGNTIAADPDSLQWLERREGGWRLLGGSTSAVCARIRAREPASGRTSSADGQA
jgi:hypothetical protein